MELRHRLDPKLDREREIDLVDGRHAEWPAADQGQRDTCVAFAVASCVELLQARDGSEFRPLSPQFLYWHMRSLPPPDHPPPGWALGATKLGMAREVLGAYGICPLGACPYPVVETTPLEGPRPDKTAMAQAAAHRFSNGTYHDYPTPESRPAAGVARQVYARLAEGYPVALAVPVHAETPESVATNWDNPDVHRSGKVHNPPVGWAPTVAERGHVVCVTGFQRDPREPTGGWFVFRNSRGLNWSRYAPFGPQPPRVPLRGWGAISATHVERYCWELLSPGPA